MFFGPVRTLALELFTAEFLFGSVGTEDCCFCFLIYSFPQTPGWNNFVLELERHLLKNLSANVLLTGERLNIVLLRLGKRQGCLFLSLLLTTTKLEILANLMNDNSPFPPSPLIFLFSESAYSEYLM